LDFFAWNNYDAHPDSLSKQPYRARKMLDELGFDRTEIQVAEWNYFPGDWSKIFDPLYWNALAPEINGPNGAAYICSVLSGWQDTPLDMGSYYVGTSIIIWGLFDTLTQARNKTYYAMKAFNLIAKYENRINAKVESADSSVRVLSGRKATGEIAVLISCFKTGKRRITVNLGDVQLNPDRCKVSVIDAEHDLTPMEKYTISDNTITLDKPAGSAVFLVESF
jgi:hypothetical protein